MGTYLQNLICHLRLTQIPLQFGTTVFSVIIPKKMPLKKYFFFQQVIFLLPKFFDFDQFNKQKNNIQKFLCSMFIFNIFFLMFTFYKNKKDCEEYL